MPTLRDCNVSCHPRLNGSPLTMLLCTIGNTSNSLASPAQANPCIIQITVELLQQSRVHFKLVIDLH